MKRSKLFLTGMAALLLSFGLLMTGCGSDSSDDDGPAGPQDRTFTIQGAAAGTDKFLKIVADSGVINSDAVLYFKNDGTEVLVTKTPPSDGTTTYTANTGFTLKGEATKFISDAAVTVVADGSTPSAGQLLAGNVKITLKADAQDAEAPVGGISAGFGKPTVVTVESAGAGYTVDDGTTNATIKYTSGTKELKYKETNSSAVTATLDADFDVDLIAVLGALEATDTITFGAGGAITDIGVLAASPTAAKVTAALGFAPAVTLGNNLSLTADFAVPAGKTLTVGAGNTLAVAAGATVTVPDTATLALVDTALITLADNTSVINVGATTNNKFAIKGDSTGASTLTAGGGSGEIVSLQGLAAGSKILGSVNTATLAITGKDAVIDVAAATNGLTIDAVTVDVSAKGKITIAQGGVLTLPANSNVKCSTESTSLASANTKIANATIGSSIAITANEDGASGKTIGTITGAASNNTITPSGTTAVTLVAGVVNA
jgi:hypothetical protein